MRLRRLPVDDGYFALFDSIADNIAACAGVVDRLMSGLPSTISLVDKVVDHERKGDELTRAVLKRLEESGRPPFDREDIATLTDKMDDALDDLRAAADMVRLHNVERPIDGVTAMCGLIAEGATVLCTLVAKLPALRDLRPELERIDEIESRGDDLHRETIARLFSGSYEALEVLKWHDIVENLEKALNRLQRSSRIIATMAMKRG